MSVKSEIQQRIDDLKVNSKLPGTNNAQLIEQTALFMLHRDLAVCAAIARDVVSGSSETDPDVADVLAVHQLFQAYLPSAYSSLLSAGDIPPPPVQTNNSSLKTKDQLDA